MSPLWARLEAEAATFAPRRIAPARRAPWRIALVGIVAVAGLIGLANSLPGLPAHAPVAQLAVPTTASPTDPTSGQVGGTGAPGRAPITLRTPTGRDGPITTASVHVDGQVVLRVSSIQIAIELDRFRRIDTVDIDTNPDGTLRPDTTPAFHLDLALPTPRPIGQAWVVITAYDRSGNSLGTVRRAVLIGAETAS